MVNGFVTFRTARFVELETNASFMVVTVQTVIRAFMLDRQLPKKNGADMSVMVLTRPFY